MAIGKSDPLPPRVAYAIVAARFNLEIVERLIEGARAGLRELGVAENTIEIVWVPGSLELPLIAKRLAESGRYAAIICLGAVIRGETDHYEYVCQEAAAGIMQAGLATGVPVLFGVLTCATVELALARAGGPEGNKGYDVALAAVDMAQLIRKLDSP